MSLNFQQAKQLIGDPTIPDQEVEEILSVCKSLTEILFQRWMEERKVGQKLLVK